MSAKSDYHIHKNPHSKSDPFTCTSCCLAMLASSSCHQLKITDNYAAHLSSYYHCSASHLEAGGHPEDIGHCFWIHSLYLPSGSAFKSDWQTSCTGSLRLAYLQVTGIGK